MFYKDVEVDGYERSSFHREVWKTKPALNYFYTEVFFKKIRYCCNSLPILEVGSGPSFLKDYWPDVVTSDVVYMPWLDLVCRCENLPFTDSTFAYLVCIDVFHHLTSPIKFMEEAQRVVKAGGQIIMIEPWITPISYILWKYIHHEMCERVENPWENAFRKDKRLFDGNVYIPYQYFGLGNRIEFRNRHPQLELKKIELLGVFVYPLTGGFQPKLGIRSINLIKVLLSIERFIAPLFSHLSATRALIVLENLKQDCGDIG